MNRLLKPGVALVATLGLLILSATPAPAAVVTGGTLTLDTITLNLPGSCAPATLTMTATSATAGTITVGITQGAFTYSSVNYVFVGAMNGTYSLTSLGGTTYFMTAHLGMGGVIRRASPSNPCSPTGTSECAVIVSSSLTLNGAADLSTTQPVAGSLHISAGSRTMSTLACTTSTFTHLNGKTASVSSLTTTI